MARITKLPKGLKYSVVNGLKTLDLCSTYVNMIPKRLKGVDVVVAKGGQIEYVDPSFKGHLMESMNGSFVDIDTKKMSVLKQKFIGKEAISSVFFQTAYSAKDICALYPDEEIHLPSDLHFLWDAKTGEGCLKAHLTWLTEKPKIEGVNMVSLPSSEALLERYEAIKQAKKAFRKKRYGIPQVRHKIDVWHKEM